MIICGCSVRHVDHQFKPRDGSWGLCSFCSHALAAHKSGSENGQVRQLLDLISNATTVKTLSITPIGPDQVQLTLELDLS